PDLFIRDALGRLAGTAGQIADVPHARHDDIALATEEALDRLRFCLRLDNDERSCHEFALLSVVPLPGGGSRRVAARSARERRRMSDPVLSLAAPFRGIVRREWCHAGWPRVNSAYPGASNGAAYPAPVPLLALA